MSYFNIDTYFHTDACEPNIYVYFLGSMFLDDVFLWKCRVTFCIDRWTNQHSAFGVLVCDWSNALDPLTREMNSPYRLLKLRHGAVLSLSLELLLELSLEPPGLALLKPRCVSGEVSEFDKGKLKEWSGFASRIHWHVIYIFVVVYWCELEVLWQHWSQ